MQTESHKSREGFVKEVSGESRLLALKNLFNQFLEARRKVCYAIFRSEKTIREKYGNVIIDLQFKELIFDNRIRLFLEGKQDYEQLAEIMQEEIDALNKGQHIPIRN